jgi:hypothetical protein
LVLHPQAINYVAWASLNKESLWPYNMTNGTCNSTIYGSTSGQAVKLRSGATRVSPGSDETALKTVRSCWQRRPEAGLLVLTQRVILCFEVVPSVTLQPIDSLNKKLKQAGIAAGGPLSDLHFIRLADWFSLI